MRFCMPERQLSRLQFKTLEEFVHIHFLTPPRGLIERHDEEERAKALLAGADEFLAGSHRRDEIRHLRDVTLDREIFCR